MINNYLNTTEYKLIKDLLNENTILYVTEKLKDILMINKKNNSTCFTKRITTPLINKGIIYVRLSDEDISNNISKSILNQLLMLLTFCNDKKINVVGIFYEEDISGIDATRIEWNKSLKFCELGNTDIYVCKTQARFARSIEFIEKYLHKKFIEWNIRFLSIVDNIDTYNKDNKKSSQITAMVDEWRIEEQSINTKKTLRAKNNAGEWTGAFAPYGYKEDPQDRYHLIIDEEAAKIVKMIYQLYIEGMGYTKICNKLNSENIPTPSKYKKLIGSKYRCPNYPNGTDYWNIDTIRKILHDETYDGLLIQHRTEKVAYNIKKIKRIPKCEQSIIACAHERIIDSEISKIVRNKFKEINANRIRPNKDGNIHIFSGKVYCEECNHIFQKNMCKSGSNYSINKKAYLHCRNHNCNNKSYIRYEVLENIILKEINKMIDIYGNEKLLNNYYNIKKNKDKTVKKLQKEKEIINSSINILKRRFITLYYDKADGFITNKEYLLLKDNNQKDLDNIRKRINLINKKLLNNNKSLNINHFRQLNRLIIEKYISRIIIGKQENNNRLIKIVWNTN